MAVKNKVPKLGKLKLSGLDLAALHQSFCESEYGRRLSGRPRFIIYKPPHISDGEWIELLGRDADNLEHLIVTYEIALEFSRSLKPQVAGASLRPIEEEILLITALIHDWAEAVVGDINFNVKTDSDLHNELKHLESICSELAVEQDLVRQVAAVLSNQDQKLSEIFNIIERIGYVSTAEQAYLLLGQCEDDSLLYEGLVEMCVSVVHNCGLILSRYAKKYPYLKEFLSARNEFLEHSCSFMLDDAQDILKALSNLTRD